MQSGLNLYPQIFNNSNQQATAKMVQRVHLILLPNAKMISLPKTKVELGKAPRSANKMAPSYLLI